ncbi:flagellin [Alicyclobacillus cellulosilyticus]|uniref:Flagellin n=1 Tax=Alicyclobacillus cellulosilyticus TaxID=1003997 RepID=A0A917NKY6_9BACL|nr:flagellin [Alicyclobacillus cellulosilyticus]GGJ08483.1 flagellin [Alicyclobacillus cellulosilyticus]
MSFGLIINHNLGSMNALAALNQNQNSLQQVLQQLSTGKRINSAADDAAGLAISQKMQAQINGLNQASRNAQDGISLIQTAEGALNETQSILQRMRQLVVQANNGTNTSDDLKAIQEEISQLQAEIDRIGNKTQFNTKNLLDGSLGVKAADGTVTIAALTAAGITADVSGVKSGTTLSFTLDTTNKTITVSDGTTSQTLSQDPTNVKAGTVLNFDKVGLTLIFGANVDLTKYDGTNSLDGQNITTTGNTLSFQIGPNGNTTLDISIADMRSSALGTGTSNTTVTDLSKVNVTTASFDENVAAIDQAIRQVSDQRAQLGAYQNRLEHTINNLEAAAQNLTSAESGITDTNMASAMAEFTKDNVLQQAAISMLAQANQQPQLVLKLLG